MSNVRSRWQGFVTIIAVTAATLIPVTIASAQDNGNRQAGEGKYANLTALWWQWVLVQPALDIGGTNTNPVLDTTGAYALSGQEDGIGPGGKYIFLAGTFGGEAKRTVTVPAGKALFFPMATLEVDNANDPPTDSTVPQLVAKVKAAIDAFIGYYARLDGKDLEVFRTTSPVFSYTVPDENSIYDYFGMVGPQFEGWIKPAVSDGYWAVIPPLPPGDYVLSFGATSSSGFNLNVVYFLTVE
jgi:hypothetical protein